MEQSTLPLTVLAAVAKIEWRAQQLLLGSREALFSNLHKLIGILRACAAEIYDKKAEYYLARDEPGSVQWLEKSAQETLKDTLALIDAEELRLDLSTQSRRRVGRELRQAVESRLKHWKPRVQVTKSQAQAPQQRRAIRRLNARRDFVEPILRAKGWSVFDWATDSEVDHHTAMDYLRNRTTPRRSTILKLAKSLGVSVEALPL